VSPFVIKICGVTSSEDVLSAIGAGATAIGFNFYQLSPRFINLSRLRSLAALVPPDIRKVGVFVTPSVYELERAVDVASLDIVQIHGVIPAVIPDGARLWRALPVTEERTEKTDLRAEAHLLDTPTDGTSNSLPGGSGRTFDWSLAASWSSGRIILAGGLDAENVAAAIRRVKPWGVDACSRLESEPGRKDPQKVKAFVDTARATFLAISSVTKVSLMKERVELL
jgi:phosphoribosylanthranilate isomerase